MFFNVIDGTSQPQRFHFGCQPGAPRHARKVAIVFSQCVPLPKVDRPSYFETPVTLAKAQKNENEVAGTMPDESPAARISDGEAVPQPRDQRLEDNAFHRRRIFLRIVRF
jgi:hypothetical protein